MALTLILSPFLAKSPDSEASHNGHRQKEGLTGNLNTGSRDKWWPVKSEGRNTATISQNNFTEKGN